MKKSSLLASTLAITLAIGCLTPASNADAASKLSLSTKKVTLKVSKSTTVHANKKVTWKSSNAKIAKVKKLSNKKAKITAKAAGSCKITATSGKSKAVIRVTVNKSKTTVTATPKPTATVAPVTKPQASASSQPVNTLTPEEKEPLENAIPEQMPTVTATPAPTQDSTEYTASADGILISVTEYTTTGIKYTITNSNTTEISFGYNYILQKSENGDWVNVPYQNNDWAFPALAIGLPANNSYNASINWEYMYGALTNGTYRIVKSFYHNSNKYDIAFEFVIDETTPVNTAAPTTTPEPGTPTATPAVATTEPAVTPAVVLGN